MSTFLMKARIYKNVILGTNCEIEDYCEIGKPSGDKKKGKLQTIIGNNAIIRSGTVIYCGVKIGNNFQTGHHVLIREGNKIGNNVSIGTNSTVEVDNIIGDNVRIHSLCFLEKVKLGKNVFVGPHVAFFDDPHPSIPRGRNCIRGAVVKESAKIGGGSRILPFVTIGKNSLVGAGSVVIKNVPDNTVVVGNPAKKLKKIGDIICKRKGARHYPYDSLG